MWNETIMCFWGLFENGAILYCEQLENGSCCCGMCCFYDPKHNNIFFFFFCIYFSPVSHDFFKRKCNKIYWSKINWWMCLSDAFILFALKMALWTSYCLVDTMITLKCEEKAFWSWAKMKGTNLSFLPFQINTDQVG